MSGLEQHIKLVFPPKYKAEIEVLWHTSRQHHPKQDYVYANREPTLLRNTGLEAAPRELL